MSTALVSLALMLLSAGGESTSDAENEHLALLTAKRARWSKQTGLLEMTGAGKFTGDDLRVACGIRAVRTLRIAYTLTDKDLEYLSNAESVQSLVLQGNHFTDQAILHVGRMPALKSVELESTRLTAEGIRVLAAIDRLESLSLFQLSLSPEAIAELKALPALHGWTCIGRNR